MLDKLEIIANQLDEVGMHKEAEVITQVMVRLSNINGPIQDFNSGGDESQMPDFMNGMMGNQQMGNQMNDQMEMMNIHSALRGAGIDPSGLNDDAARQMYQSIMSGQVNNLNLQANTSSKFKRMG
jgi:hypothetical protein